MQLLEEKARATGVIERHAPPGNYVFGRNRLKIHTYV